MAASIFNGSAIKLLKNILKFKSGTQITASGSVDPSTTATTGSIGDLFFSTTVGRWFTKTDSGSSTNWAGLSTDYQNLTTKTGNYTLTKNDSIVLVDATSGNFAITLPTAVGIAGKQYTIKKINTTNTVTISRTSSQTVDGAAYDYKLTNINQTFSVVSDGTNWRVIEDNFSFVTANLLLPTAMVTSTVTKQFQNNFNQSSGFLTYNTSLYRCDVSVSGLYRVSYSINIPNGGNLNTVRVAYIYVNGAEVMRSQKTYNTAYAITLEPYWEGTLAAGDYVEFFSFQDSGSSITPSAAKFTIVKAS